MFNKFRALIIILLAAIIITSSVIAWSKYRPNEPIEISLPPPPTLEGQIYISGAVSNPGFYPLAGEDSVESLIQAAGGTTNGADPTQLELYVPELDEGHSSQKIDINQAEAWLLEALPGIGEVRAQAVIDHRRQNGPFHNISELTKVDGIGAATYEQIKDLITVAD